MCNPNKLADIQAAEHNEALALAATQAAETTKPSETDKGTVVESKTNEAANSRASLLADIEAKMPPYIPATEQPDDVLVEGIFERLQLMLHPFAVGQVRLDVLTPFPTSAQSIVNEYHLSFHLPLHSNLCCHIKYYSIAKKRRKAC